MLNFLLKDRKVANSLKKITLYVICLVFLTFLIPALFTIPNKNIVVAKVNENSKNDFIQYENLNNIQDEGEVSQVKYDYGQYNTIKLLHKKSNVVEEIELDDYLYGVVSAEMPVDFEIEALKAQAVVARTYTIYKIINNGQKHENADICDDPNCCQAWISKEERFTRWDLDKQIENWNKIVTAVNETKGIIITYQGKPINAFFHSNSGGYTEAPINVWGGSRISIFTICSNKW